MGLDTVELVMAFEQAFDLEIPDRAAEEMQTPRKVVEYVALQRPELPLWVIENKVKTIICDQLGLDDATWASPTKRGVTAWNKDFIMDLGAD